MFFFFVKLDLQHPDFANLPSFSAIHGCDVRISSELFDDFTSCCIQANEFLTFIKNQLDSDGKQYQILRESHPSSSDEEPIGIGELGSWQANELVKYYLVKSFEGDQESASTNCLISIVSSPNHTQQ